MKELTQLQQDALKEIGNMGAGKASASLSKLVNRKVLLEAPTIALITIDEVAGLIGGEQELVVGSYSTIKGDMAGTMLVTAKTKDAMLLVDLLKGKEIGGTLKLDEESQEKMKGATGVLTKDYLDSLVEFLGLKIDKTAEKIISTFGESLADLVVYGIDEENALFITTNFGIDGTNFRGRFIMLIAMNSVDKLIEAIESQLS